MGKVVEAQYIELDNVTSNLREFYVEAYLGKSPKKAPKYWLLFPVSVPPLGLNSYFVSKASHKGTPARLSYLQFILCLFSSIFCYTNFGWKCWVIWTMALFWSLCISFFSVLHDAGSRNNGYISAIGLEKNETVEIGPGNLKLSFSLASGQLTRIFNSKTGVNCLLLENRNNKIK